MKSLVRLAALAVPMVLAATAMAAPPIPLTLVGEDGKTVSVSAAEIKAMPHEGATITHEGKTTGYRGPLLTELLKHVKAPTGPDLRGPGLSDVVIVTAADGYVVALALSDLEPSISPSKVILADETDKHAPLDADGPYRLVVDGDLKPARSARNVVRIEVRRLRADDPSIKAKAALTREVPSSISPALQISAFVSVRRAPTNPGSKTHG